MTQKRKSMLILCGIALGSFLVLCILNATMPVQRDVADFKRWGNYILNNGTRYFYEGNPNIKNDVPVDYPPIYPLICAGVAWICRLFNASVGLENFLFRLPSALILTASIFVFYFLIKSFIQSSKKSLIITAVFAFAPAIIIDIVWGQVDSFIIFFLIISLLFFVKEKYFRSLLTCTLGMLIKIQFIFILPVIGFAILYRMHKNRQLKKFFIFVGICIMIYLSVYLPFIYKPMLNGKVFYLFEILIKAIGHYNMFNVNAFNLYCALGVNYYSPTGFVLYPAWYFIINVFVILLIVIGSIILFIKKPTNINLVLLSAFSVTAIFMLTTNMQARYMLPALAGMLIAAHSLKRKKLLVINYFFYAVQFINIAFTLFCYYDWRFTRPVEAILLSALSVIAFGFFSYETIRYSFIKEEPGQIDGIKSIEKNSNIKALDGQHSIS